MSERIETVALASPDEEATATFAPSAGMVCCSLRHRGEELLAQRDGVLAYAEQGSTMGIPLLHPWANRLSGFTYGAAHRVVELTGERSLLTLDENGLPIHGVLPSHVPWEVREHAAHRLRARMRWEVPSLLAVFPFPHELDYEVAIANGSLTIETILRACSEVAVPVSFGYHPYLQIPGADRDGWEVELPEMQSLTLDGRMIPTGDRERFEGRRFELGSSSWDHAFGGLARALRFAVASAGRRIELAFLEGYPYAQVFSPAGENFICFEPMTAPANALVSGADLRVVGPGEELRASFRIAVADQR